MHDLESFSCDVGAHRYLATDMPIPVCYPWSAVPPFLTLTPRCCFVHNQVLARLALPHWTKKNATCSHMLCAFVKHCAFLYLAAISIYDKWFSSEKYSAATPAIAPEYGCSWYTWASLRQPVAAPSTGSFSCRVVLTSNLAVYVRQNVLVYTYCNWEYSASLICISQILVGCHYCCLPSTSKWCQRATLSVIQAHLSCSWRGQHSQT